MLGWILLRGRCRRCGERISVVYPLIELATALLVAAAMFTYDRVWVGVMVAALMALMPAISVIDIRHKLIPNAITYPATIGFAAFILLAWLFDGGTDPVRAFLGMLAYGGGLFVLAMISRGMGMGDAKLAVVIGLVLGSIGLGIVGVAAGAAIVLGGLGGVVALFLGLGRKARIPFGPYMAAGADRGGLLGAADRRLVPKSVHDFLAFAHGTFQGSEGIGAQVRASEDPRLRCLTCPPHWCFVAKLRSTEVL